MTHKFNVGDRVTINGGLEVCEIITITVSLSHGPMPVFIYSLRVPSQAGFLVPYPEDALALSACGCGICYGCTLARVKNTLLQATSVPNPIHPHFGVDFSPGESYTIRINTNECECGTKNAVGQGHSQWCKCYRKEF